MGEAGWGPNTDWKIIPWVLRYRWSVRPVGHSFAQTVRAYSTPVRPMTSASIARDLARGKGARIARRKLIRTLSPSMTREQICALVDRYGTKVPCGAVYRGWQLVLGHVDAWIRGARRNPCPEAKHWNLPEASVSDRLVPVCTELNTANRYYSVRK